MSDTKLTVSKIWRQQKKDGQTTLPFKDWIERENQKEFMNFGGENVKPINDSLNKTIDQMHTAAGLKKQANSEYVFGINRKILIGVTVVGVAVAGFFIYKKLKK